MHLQLLDRLRAFVGMDEDGQGLAEYALIISIIALLSIILLRLLGSQISGQLSQIGGSI